MTKSDFRRSLQMRNLEHLRRNGGFNFTDTFFPYTEGKIGTYYVHAERALDGSQTAVSSIAWLIQHITNRKEGKEEYDFISGGERRDFPFSNAVAYVLGKAPVMLFKDKSMIGPELKALGPVIHVADLNNVGSSVRDLWVPIIRGNFGKINRAVFYVDRMEGGTEAIKSVGVQSESVVPLDNDAWNYLLAQGTCSPEAYKQLQRRNEDKESWAREMLKSDAGLERTVDLLNQSPKVRSSMIKVILQGYPDITEDLISRIKDRAYCLKDPVEILDKLGQRQ